MQPGWCMAPVYAAQGYFGTSFSSYRDTPAHSSGSGGEDCDWVPYNLKEDSAKNGAEKRLRDDTKVAEFRGDEIMYEVRVANTPAEAEFRGDGSINEVRVANTPAAAEFRGDGSMYELRVANTPAEAEFRGDGSKHELRVANTPVEGRQGNCLNSTRNLSDSLSEF